LCYSEGCCARWVYEAMTNEASRTSNSQDTQPRLLPVSARALIIALLVSVLGIHYQTASNLGGLGAGMQLPFAVLFVLVALHPLLARLIRLHRADIIVIYCFVLVAASSYDGVSRFMPNYTVPQYFAAPENNYEMIANQYIPDWFIPKDREVVRMYYEGAGDEPVSMRPWVVPISLWVLFFMTLWGTLYCVVALLRRHWVEHEHLAFPLVTVPLYIAAAGAGRFRPRTSIWAEPLMWVGFTASLLHFLSIMVHAVNPGVTGEQEQHGWADPLAPRLALIGAACGFVALCLWYNLAGMSWWVAGIFFALIVLFATIFTRGRAESGVASTASFPFWQASRQLKSFLGSRALMPGGSHSNLVLLGSLIFLHFGTFPEGMTFQIESLKLGEEARVKTGHMTALIIGAMLVGLLVNFHTFLSMSYEWGANTLQGGTTQGGYHVSISRREYAEVSAVIDGNHLAPNWNRNGFTILAFAFTLALVALRDHPPHRPLQRWCS